MFSIAWIGRTFLFRRFWNWFNRLLASEASCGCWVQALELGLSECKVKGCLVLSRE